MDKKKGSVLSGYHKRKQERINYFNNNVKYWLKVDCTACNGSGYYDVDGSPNCGSCDGTGKEVINMPYHSSLTDTESLIGKTLILQVGELENILIYVNKRREVIYQYENMIDPNNKVRVRSRLHFGYTRNGNNFDWYFKDLDGEEFYLSNFTQINH